jgi:hypothetical protein
VFTLDAISSNLAGEQQKHFKSIHHAHEDIKCMQQHKITTRQLITTLMCPCDSMIQNITNQFRKHNFCHFKMNTPANAAAYLIRDFLVGSGLRK